MEASLVLVVAAGGALCGLPLFGVEEVFRPLPVSALGQPVPGVLGLVRVRGEAVPLVDLNALLGLPSGQPGRFVSLKVAGRRVALAVESVSGLRRLGAGALPALPPLLAEGAPAVEAIASLDAELLLLLRAGRLLPDEAAA